MCKFFKKATLAVVSIAFSVIGFANNVDVTNVSLSGQDVSAGTNNVANFTNVEFDVSWDNSWRVSTGPGNWDAVWVFAKFKVGNGNYQHATLSSNAAHHVITTNNGTTGNITPSSDGKGVFIHRSANGTGSINWDDIMLRWNYRTDGVNDNDSVTIQVFAIEMVYIPQGSFYLGDGNRINSPTSSAFRINNVPATTPEGNDAYLVTSEGAITTVNTTSTSTTSFYDPITASKGANASYVLPAAFPKGFNAFYCMKYEVSQKQYVDFFNTLPTAPASDASKGNRSLSGNQTYRNNFNWDGLNLSDAVIANSGSGDRAQNWMNYADATAYADWAALRPMTEFEFEKAARGNDVTYGPVYPVNGEFAWGNTVIYGPNNTLNQGTAVASLNTYIANSNLSNENASTATTNWNCNYTLNTSSTYNQATTGNGPVRVGLFGAKTYSSLHRQQSGASFYGVMEMSGNVEEIVIAAVWNNAYNSTNTYLEPSPFTGVHGNGALNAGNADVTDWTLASCSSGATCTGVFPVLKGGSWATLLATGNLRTSFRNTYSNSIFTSSVTSYGGVSRTNAIGFRAVRTAP